MTSVFNWRTLSQFPPIIWTILVGGFLVRGTYFMIWPFMAVILYRKFGLSATIIGLVLSTSIGCSALAGFYAGALSDRLGRNRVMLVAGVIGITAFSVLAYAEPLWVYVVAMTAVSIARTMWDAPAGALIGDHLNDVNAREMALQVRYFLINCGAAVGPLAGVWLGMTGEQSTFMLPAVCFAMLLIAFAWAGKKERQSNINGLAASKQHINLKRVLTIFGRDHYFLMVIFANIMTFFIFAHMDSSLLQYMERKGGANTVALFASLILTNALTVICSQFLLLKLMEHWRIKSRVTAGLVLLTASQLWFALNPLDWRLGWILATLILSLGEAILFPTMAIQVDRLAPAHLRGAYFGATSLYSLGWAMSPIVGGLILDHWGGPALFLLCTSLCLLLIWLYQISDRFKRGDETAVAVPEAENVSDSA